MLLGQALGHQTHQAGPQLPSQVATPLRDYIEVTTITGFLLVLGSLGPSAGISQGFNPQSHSTGYPGDTPQPHQNPPQSDQEAQNTKGGSEGSDIPKKQCTRSPTLHLDATGSPGCHCFLSDPLLTAPLTGWEPFPEALVLITLPQKSKHWT